MKDRTHRLDKDADLLKLTGAAFGTQANASMSGYLRLPVSVPDGPLPNTSWLLLLELTGKNHGLLPFEIAADVVLGRGTEGEDAPDLDLTALNAYEMGVSRRHAMLRPTTNHLYLIDLGSTNGCTVNGLSTGKGATPLRRHDHITLGQMNMRILTLERVVGAKEAAQQAPTQAAAPSAPVVIVPPTPTGGTSTPPIETRVTIPKPADPTLPLPPNVEPPNEVKKHEPPIQEKKPEAEKPTDAELAQKSGVESSASKPQADKS